MTSFPVLQKLS